MRPETAEPAETARPPMGAQEQLYLQAVFQKKRRAL